MVDFHAGTITLPGLMIHKDTSFDEFYKYFVSIASTVHVHTVEDGIVQNVGFDLEEPIKMGNKLSLHQVYANVVNMKLVFCFAPRHKRAIERWVNQNIRGEELIACANYGALTFRWGDVRLEDTLQVQILWHPTQDEIQRVVSGK